MSHHLGERKVRTVEDDDDVSIAGSIATESEITVETNNDSENDDTDSDNEAIQETEDKDDHDHLEEREDSESEADPNFSNEKEEITSDQVEEIESNKTENSHTSLIHSQATDKCENNIELTYKTELNEESCNMDSNDSEGKTLITVRQQYAVVPKVEFPDTEIGLQHISGDK